VMNERQGRLLWDILVAVLLIGLLADRMGI
jgi:hypothetical protein